MSRLQITATFIKIVSIIFQYGLLFLLLAFIYKVIRYMKEDVKPLVEDAYAKVEITNEEAGLVVLNSGDESLLNQKFIFSDELMVGRSPQSDIVINDNFVSHNHARIYMLNNQYVLEDLGSANGTYLNDVRLDGNTYLQTGDIITIGTVTFEFTR